MRSITAGGRRCGFRRRGVAAFMGSVFLAALGWASAFAVVLGAEAGAIGSAKLDFPAAQTVNMVCVDAEGRAVAGAEVHLYQLTAGEDGRFEHSGMFTTDAEGKAACNVAVFSSESGNFDRWFYARVPGRLVGAARAQNGRTRPRSTRRGG